MTTGNAARTGALAATPLVEVVVTEDLTPTMSGRLHTLLMEALDLRPQQLVVDVTLCSYADIHAVVALLDAHRRMLRLGGQLVLRGPSPRLRRLFRLAHVDHVLAFAPADYAASPVFGLSGAAPSGAAPR